MGDHRSVLRRGDGKMGSSVPHRVEGEWGGGERVMRVGHDAGTCLESVCAGSKGGGGGHAKHCGMHPTRRVPFPKS